MRDDLTAARYGLSTFDCVNASVSRPRHASLDTDHLDDDHKPVTTSGVSNSLLL